MLLNTYPVSLTHSLCWHCAAVLCAGASKGFYTYSAFVTAAAVFPGFGTSSVDPAANKRELAAFLGQISHETTGGWPTAPDGPYSWGLCWITEGEPAAWAGVGGWVCQGVGVQFSS